MAYLKSNPASDRSKLSGLTESDHAY